MEFYRLWTKLREGNVFSRVCLLSRGWGPDVTITHDKLDLTVPGPPPGTWDLAIQNSRRRTVRILLTCFLVESFWHAVAVFLRQRLSLALRQQSHKRKHRMAPFSLSITFRTQVLTNRKKAFSTSLSLFLIVNDSLYHEELVRNARDEWNTQCVLSW